MAKNAVTENNLNERLQNIVSDLEAKTDQLMVTLRSEQERAEETMRENLWISLASALGLGLVFGLLLGFTRR